MPGARTSCPHSGRSTLEIAININVRAFALSADGTSALPAVRSSIYYLGWLVSSLAA